MAKNTGRRLRELESTKEGGESITAVYWGDGLITVKGRTISIEDFKKIYPDHKVVSWDDDDDDQE